MDACFYEVMSICNLMCTFIKYLYSVERIPPTTVPFIQSNPIQYQIKHIEIHYICISTQILIKLYSHIGTNHLNTPDSYHKDPPFNL